MVADGDLCTLPENIITLFAAAEVLARDKSPDAELKMVKAKNAMRRYALRQTANKNKPFVIGGGSASGGNNHGRIGLDYVPPGYGSGPAR